MSLANEITNLQKQYGAKRRQLKFLRRKQTSGNITIDENLEKYWAEICEINKAILDKSPESVKVEIDKAIQNQAASGRLFFLWKTIHECAEMENEFIERFLPTVKNGPARNKEIEKENISPLIGALNTDVMNFKRFRKDFIALSKYPLEVNIIGIGEITTTIELLGAPNKGIIDPRTGRKVPVAIKKMPLFPTREAARSYVNLFDEYHGILQDQIGIPVPPWGSWVKRSSSGETTVYNRQERLPQHSIAALAIHKLSDEANRKLFRLIMEQLAKVFKHNASNPEIIIGFDAQLPNWSIEGLDPDSEDWKDYRKLVYIDTGTPLMRRRLDTTGDGSAEYGADLLDIEIFLKAVPAPIRPIVRHTMAKEVVNRYYEPVKVIIDLVASYYLYNRPDLIPVLVEDTNAFIESELPDFSSTSTPTPTPMKPFTVKQMEAYHRSDTRMWVFLRAVKRFDRFITEKILRRKYGQRLPKEKFTPGPFTKATNKTR